MKKETTKQPSRNDAAPVQASGAVVHEAGLVTRSPADGLQVQTESGVFDAQPAASCLLRPELGDEVLLAVPARGDLFVLAVLRRASDGPATLRIDDTGLSIAVPHGKMNVVARDGIEFVTPEGLGLTADRLKVNARDGVLNLARMLLTSTEIVARSEKIEGVFQHAETIASRLTQRLERSYRFVEETDVTRAEEIDTRANGRLLMRAKDAFVNARRLFKVDGEQIHMG